MRGRRLAIAIALGIGVGMSSVAAAGAFGAPHPGRAPTTAPVPSSARAGTGPTETASTPVFAAGTYSGREPRKIDISVDAGNIVTNLRWKRWTASSAVGRGTSDADGCVPDCATAPAVAERTSVTLSRPRNGHFTAMTEVRGGRTQRFSYPAVWPLGATSSPSAASTPRSGVPAVEDSCTGPAGTPALATRPASIVIACADDGMGADDLSWTAWGASEARGKGVIWVHVCTPDCASSTTYRRYPATITLGDVVGTPTGPVFSVMSAAYPATGPRYPTGSLISRFTLAYPRA
ncbi:MAG TPA: hypothetical protein VND62_09220 [Acidimicrobiales bacterium]|nr:hypothetical protein [Acidimicrobiales bacterium]